MKKIDRKWAIPLSIAICLIIMYICTVTGVASISFRDANRILLHEIFHTSRRVGGKKKLKFSGFFTKPAPL